VLNYTGPQPDNPATYMLDEGSQYSWIKSPRYQDQPMEVGPLAHILIMHGRNTQPTDKLVRAYVEAYWVRGLGLSFGQLNSTLGRIFARMLETKIIADQIAGRPADPATGTPAYAGWYSLYYAGRSGAHFNPAAFEMVANATNKVGFGYTEAPRGALGHWIQIGGDGMISHYQCVVASQWNAGPRDNNGTAGPYEFALTGHVLANLQKPLEVLRTIHSFDPCIGRAVHIMDADGEPLVKVNVNHLAMA
jgi:hydrogenase large subunit